MIIYTQYQSCVMGSVRLQAFSTMLLSQALRLARSKGSMSTESIANVRPATTTILGKYACG